MALLCNCCCACCPSCLACCFEQATCGACIESGVFMKPTDANAPALAGALGLPISSVKYNALGDGNEGALSAMCKIHLEFPEENEMTRELSDVVIKCPPSGAERLFTDPWDMFRKEVKFYELVAKECPIRTPKAHYAKVAAGGQGTLVFEDLSLLSGAVFSDPWVSDDKLETSVSRCKNVITQLAAMHAKYWNSPRFGHDLKYFATNGKGLARGSGNITVMHHFFYNNGWPKYKENGLFDNTGNMGMLGDMLLEKFPQLYMLMYNNAAAPRTLIHGDTGVYNMMFYEGEKMCLFDWQFCQAGNGIFDIAFFLSLSVGTEMLEKNEADFLKLYHSELLKNGVKDYTEEQMNNDYKIGLVTSWAIIVYVTSLLASKGPSWDQPIAIASERTIKACERTEAVEYVLQLLA